MIVLSISELSGWLSAGEDWIVEKKVVLYELTEDVTHEDMDLLNAGGAGGWNDQGVVSDFGQHSSVISREGDGLYTHLFGDLKGFEDVRGSSAGADPDGNIPFFPKGFELFGKDFIKREVVGDAGQDRGVRGQSDCRQWGAIHNIAIDKLCRQMLGICSTPAISKEEEFIPHLKTVGDKFNHLKEIG